MEDPNKALLRLEQPGALVNHYTYCLRREKRTVVKKALVDMVMRLLRRYRWVQAKLTSLRSVKAAGIGALIRKRRLKRRLKSSLATIEERLLDWMKKTIKRFG